MSKYLQILVYIELNLTPLYTLKPLLTTKNLKTMSKKTVKDSAIMKCSKNDFYFGGRYSFDMDFT